MIDLLEKIQWIVSGVVVLLFAGFFVYPGLPKPLPDILPPQSAVSAQEFERGLTKEQLSEYRRKIIKASSAAKKLSRSMGAVKTEQRFVPPEVYEVGRDFRQAVAQAKLVQGVWDKRKRVVKLTGFKEGSYLPSLGFKEGDTIELIDGAPLPSDQAEARRLYEEKLRDLENGGAITVTVNRGGRRINMSFRLSDLQMISR